MSKNDSVPLNNRKEWNNSSLAQFKSQKLLEGVEDTEELPPTSHRKCTDCIMLLLFIAYWVGMVAIGGLGFQNGNPNRLGKPCIRPPLRLTYDLGEYKPT